MINRVAKEEAIDGLVDRDVFIKGMNSLDFNVGDEVLRTNIFKKIDVKGNYVITDHALINFMNASKSFSKN